jgi:hypothetical protein
MGRGEIWPTWHAGLEEASLRRRPSWCHRRPRADRGDRRRCDDGHPVDRGGSRRPRQRHRGHGLRHDRLLRCGHGTGRDRRRAAGQNGQGVATEAAVERSRSHHPESDNDRPATVEEGLWLPSADARGERLLPVQVDHRGSPSSPDSRRARSRGAARVQCPERDDRHGPARLVRHRPVKASGSGSFTVCFDSCTNAPNLCRS